MAAPGAERDLGRVIALGLALTAVYVMAARLGFQVAFVSEQVTTVWAPTGIAMAALLLWGLPFWPAVWLGALVANAGSSAPLWTAAAIATGNTLEAVAAAWALRRFAGFDPALGRVRDVLAFLIIAVVFSTAISATIGAGSLCLADVQPWARFTRLWSEWWLGDALGALVVAPILLTTIRATWKPPREWVEAGALIGAAVVATHVVFGQLFGGSIAQHPLEYVVFPFVIAAAMRCGQPATSLVVLAAGAVAIVDTVRGAGPFAGPALGDSLALLQVFMGVLAGTGLLLAAAIAERKTGERRRAAGYAVGEVLTQADSLADAAPGILQALCRHLGWQVGAVWLIEPEQRLRCAAVWSDGSPAMKRFALATQEAAFLRGEGLPGRVWAGGQLWIQNVALDNTFSSRKPAAREAGIRGAFAFPICLGHEVLGVIECFNRTDMSADADLLRAMSTVGNQVGQYIGRTREAAAALEAQRRTSAILDTALDGVIGMDHRGRITDFNPAAERMFGYAAADACGRDLADLLIPRALREKHREGLARYLTTGVGPFVDRRVETVAQHVDGREFPVEIAITRLSTGEHPLFTGFVRDLTARVEAEREREQLLVREAAARREAETANRAKDEFLATLSHELRTPLNAIVGWTRMLLDGTMDARSNRRALEVIDRNAHLQSQLVGDILDVSRIITGGLRLDVRPVDLGSVIGAALDVVRPAADAKRVQLLSRLSAVQPITPGDPQRLQQVVWNLLANAVKFTDIGGTVTVELLDAAGGLQIRVRDDGAGIDPAFLPHVFDRFRQADGSITREHGGLGLGLAIVRHLVELHGGTVRADSAGPGQGSTLTVELPRVDAETLPKAAGVEDQTTTEG